MLRRSSLVLALSALLVAVTPDSVAAEDDVAGIRQAVLDYANAFYLVEPELADRSVHPHLQKVGYIFPEGGQRELWMNFYQLKDLAAGWNAEGRHDAESAKREIRVLEVFDHIAVARLDAVWGVDYFHLAKKDGAWKIMNVIWQAYPEETEGASGR